MLRLFRFILYVVLVPAMLLVGGATMVGLPPFTYVQAGLEIVRSVHLGKSLLANLGALFSFAIVTNLGEYSNYISGNIVSLFPKQYFLDTVCYSCGGLIHTASISKEQYSKRSLSTWDIVQANIAIAFDMHDECNTRWIMSESELLEALELKPADPASYTAYEHEWRLEYKGSPVRINAYFEEMPDIDIADIHGHIQASLEFSVYGEDLSEILCNNFDQIQEWLNSEKVHHIVCDNLAMCSEAKYLS